MREAMRERLAADLEEVLARYNMRILRDDGVPLHLLADRDAYCLIIAPGRITPTKEKP